MSTRRRTTHSPSAGTVASLWAPHAAYVVARPCATLLFGVAPTDAAMYALSAIAFSALRRWVLQLRRLVPHMAPRVGAQQDPLTTIKAQ